MIDGVAVTWPQEGEIDLVLDLKEWERERKRIFAAL